MYKGKGVKMKKIWQTPKLVILFRGRPEEYVLGACKSANDPTAGTSGTDSACVENAVNCIACMDAGGS